jgi:glycine/D-amino acid oxidase-like deaminating enzyme
VQGVKTVAERIERYGIRCDKKHHGYLLASPFPDRLSEYSELSAHLNRLLTTADPSSLAREDGRFRIVSPSVLPSLLGSVGHSFGLYYPHGFSVNPLALCLGLGRAVVEVGWVGLGWVG